MGLPSGSGLKGLGSGSGRAMIATKTPRRRSVFMRCAEASRSSFSAAARCAPWSGLGLALGLGLGLGLGFGFGLGLGLGLGFGFGFG